MAIGQVDLQESFGFRNAGTESSPCVMCVHALHAQHARCREDRLAPEEGCTGRIESQDAGEFEDLHVGQPLLGGIFGVFDGSTEHAVSPQDQRVDPGFHVI